MARKMTTSEVDTYRLLSSQLDSHAHANRVRSDALHLRRDQAKAYRVPPRLEYVLDWPRKTIEVLSAKLLPEPFTIAGGSSLGDDLRAVYADSAVATVERRAIDAALLHGPAFVFTSPGDTTAGEPEVVVSVSSALNATADVDPRTGRVRSALEVIAPGEAHLWLPGRTLKIDAGYRVLEEYEAPKRVCCSVYTHDSTIERPFGTSRITRTVLHLTDAAVRTLMRQELSAEYYQSPRPLFFGLTSEDLLDDDGRPLLEKLTGAAWGFPDASDEDEPDARLRRAEVHWAPQMSMQPFSDQFRLIAGAYCGVSSIPAQYLGVLSDSNPTSAEAIMAQEKPLVELARMRQRELDAGRRHLAVDILTTLNGDLDQAAVTDLRRLACRWTDARHRSVSEQSQFVALQVQAGNFPAGAEESLRLLPIDEDDVQALAAANRAAAGDRALEVLTQAAANVGQQARDLALRGDTGPTTTGDAQTTPESVPGGGG